jgi:bisphosphoglycerate-independent phosphoglycerate mutase (AlkP superfamily)
MVAPENGNNLEGTGSLSDIAPTILDYLGLDIPVEMDGQSRLTAVQVQN